MKACCFLSSPLRFDIHNNDRQSIPLQNCILENIIYLIENHDVTYFISGMGKTIGLYAAETVLSLKRSYPQIILECVISYEAQAARWPENLRERFYTILGHCDKETILQKQYSNTCIQEHYHHMINRSDYVIAVWNGKISSKSINKSIKFAKSKDKKIILIDPTNL